MTALKHTSKRLSGRDVMNIKNLVTDIGGMLSFLSSEKKVSPKVREDFNFYKNNISRLLKSSGHHLVRYISEKELESLLKLIRLGEKIIYSGHQGSPFLSNNVFIIKFYDLLKDITKGYTRWLNRPLYDYGLDTEPSILRSVKNILKKIKK